MWYLSFGDWQGFPNFEGLLWRYVVRMIVFGTHGLTRFLDMPILSLCSIRVLMTAKKLCSSEPKP